MYKPVYSITHKILKNTGVIEAAKEIIDHAPLLPYYEREFQKNALVRTVHFGTHIEGNELNLIEAEKVMEGHAIVARERDIQEVINYRRVMDYVNQFKVSASRQGGQSSKVDESIIKNIHKQTVEKILPQEQIGEYRKTQVVIKNSLTGEVSFRPPPAVSVPYQITDLLDFINNTTADDIHPVLKSGIVHYELVRIHPFIDGNGRLARALSTLILFIEGYDIRKFFSLEEYFDSAAQEYYTALQSVEKKEGDLTVWLEYFTEGLAIELSKIKNKIESISIDGQLKQKLGKQLLLSDRQLKIIEYIQKTGYLQNKAFKSLFPMVSEDTILNELKALLKAKIVKKQGSTKGAKYVIR